MAALALTHGATLNHLLPLLAERGLGDASAILVASAIGPMQVAGRLAMMAVEGRVSNHGVTLASFLAMILSVLVLLIAGTTVAGLLVFAALFGGAYGTVSILRPVLARGILGQAAFGAKSGALAVLYLGAAASAPLFGALLWSGGGYGMMLLAVAAISSVGFGLYLVACRVAGTP